MDNFPVSPSVHPITIGVVIVGFASGNLLEACISGALIDPAVTAVVVVDNSSDAASKSVTEGISARDPRVRYIDPHANLGFAAGCNLGVKELDAPTHVFFVNPDVTLTRPLSPLVDQLERSGQSIIAASLTSPPDSTGENARPLVSMTREVAKTFMGNRVYKMRSMVGDRSQSAFVVGQVDGALLGMSTSSYMALNGFDEHFELYYEDVDICARAQSLGGCLFVPEEWGIHIGGASSSTVSELSYCLLGISRARYLRKRYGRSKRVSLSLVFLALVELVIRTITRQPEGTQARVKSAKLQLHELRRPGSVILLQQSAASDS